MLGLRRWVGRLLQDVFKQLVLFVSLREADYPAGRHVGSLSQAGEGLLGGRLAGLPLPRKSVLETSPHY